MTITGDKGKGVLAETDLNLSDYTEGEYRYMKLPLKNSIDPDGHIEVGLKATQAREKKTNLNESTSHPGRTSSFKDTEASKEQMI